MPDCTRFSVYVLRLPDGTLYVGSTAKAIDVRVAEHQEKRGKTTRLIGKVSWCTTREAAERIERRLAEKLRRSGKKVIQG